MEILPGLPRPAKAGELVSLDIELFGAKEGRLHRPTGRFACLSIAYSPKEVYQLYDQADVPRALERIQAGRWVLMNALFDLRHLRRWADVPQRDVWDIMIVEQDLFGGYYDRFDLHSLARRWLNTELDKQVVERFAVESKMDQEMRLYSAKDALSTVLIASKQVAAMEPQDSMPGYYWQIDAPAIWAVLDMPPMRVNVDGWLRLAKKCSQRAETIRRQLGFNPGSTQQTQAMLRQTSGSVPIDWRTKKPTTNEDAMEDFRDRALGSGDTKTVELINAILEYRMYSKAATTYGESWVEKYVEDGDLVYANWSVAGATRTGRMSCSDPNLQNIPVREMPEFRDLFLAFPGRNLLVSDVSQQEPRVSAWWSKDDILLQALLEGDVYAPIAKKFKVSRDRAKSIFLGATYGLSPRGLAARERIPLEQAQQFLDDFFHHFWKTKSWLEKQERKAYSLGYVTTPLGRRCWVNTYSPQWSNNAINYPIQGGAAEMIKLALSTVHRETALAGLPFNTCGVIHDETVDHLPRAERRYQSIVEKAWRSAGRTVIGSIPISVKPRIGKTWGVKGE